MGVSLECHETFEAESGCKVSARTKYSLSGGVSCSRRDKDCQTVPECTDDKCFFPTSLLRRRTPRLQGKTDVELHTRSASHLRESMPLVDVAKGPLDMSQRLERGMEGSIVYCSGQLSMNKHIGISSDW